MKKHRNIITASAILAAVLFIFSFDAVADRGAGVSKEMLPRELRDITINNTFIPSSGKEAGVIQEISGTVIVAREDLKQAYFAAPGDKVYEKDTFFTLKNSRCRFRLLFADVISIGDNSRISVTKFIDDKKSQEKHASFNMLKGKVMFYTMRLFRYKNASMTVDTPTAIAGVRGTKFGVEVVSLKEETETAKRPIQVADASGKAFIHLAQATLPGTQTNVHAFDGNIYVTNTFTTETQFINPGESTSSTSTGLGPVGPTPPGTSQQFQQDTSGGGTGSSGSTAGLGNQPPPPPPPPEPPPTPTPPTPPTTRMQPWTGSGYFTGLLTMENSGRQFVGTYISTDPQDFAASATAVDSSGEGGNSITADGPSKSVTAITSSAGDWPSGGDVPVPDPKLVTIAELGYTEYMSWGTWTQPVAMPSSLSYDLYLDNPNYYLNGTITPTLPTTGSYLYSGPAQGTLWTAGGGTVMTGAFSANVNFSAGSGAITNYNMSVANGAINASITNPAITVTDSNFSASSGAGTWTINSVSGATGSLYGSFYGPNAANMGSVWTMTDGSLNHATGVAIGNSKAPAP